MQLSERLICTFWEETTVKKKPLSVCMCMDKSPLWVMNYTQADLVTLCSLASFSLDSPSEMWGIITPLCFPGLLFIVFNLKTVFHINHSKYWDFKIPSVPLAWTKGWSAWTVRTTSQFSHLQPLGCYDESQNVGKIRMSEQLSRQHPGQGVLSWAHITHVWIFMHLFSIDFLKEMQRHRRSKLELWERKGTENYFLFLKKGTH